YNVTAVANQDEAVKVMDGDGASGIQLLMADILVNGAASGIELGAAADIKSRHPHLKTLFISGHADLPALVNGSDVKDAAYLQRPFMGADLIRSAQNMLTKDVA
ncbi:MAG: hypothetical protein R3229_13680, partial [Alphaproteobacteria bacterium]|nr:hypothetical protein [Alphaproteobacteria bacterium]